VNNVNFFSHFVKISNDLKYGANKLFKEVIHVFTAPTTTIINILNK